MHLENHFLVPEDSENIKIIQSPNWSAPMIPDYLIMHYTAMPTLSSVVALFQKKESQVSSHLVIGRNGEIVQMVAFDKRAWHAGKSSWGRLEGLNQYSIGIELVNGGKLSRDEDGKWVTWAGIVIRDDEVAVATHRDETTPVGWHLYPEAQLKVAIQVSSLLHTTYHFKDILGHEDISPIRKVDPGPLFPMAIFRSTVLGKA